MKEKRSSQSFYTNMAILSAVLVSESLSATLMMPFVGLFVAHLKHIPPSEAGYMSGLLISVFQLGQMLTGKMWGTASDRVGRKPMILLGLLANAVVSTFFGMSPNLTFCIITRFIHGCANGNVLVAKTVIADITDKETEGMGFAAISIFWGVGSVVGPAMGGYLYDPTHHAILGPLLFPGLGEDSGNVFAVHPALLPCLIISVFSVVTLLLISRVLPETSRRPVDPFMSLFAWSAPRRLKPTAGLGPRGGGHGSRAGVDPLITVVEDEYDTEGDDGDDEMSCGAAADSGGKAEERSFVPVSAAARPLLTKRLFTSTNTLGGQESINQLAASGAMLKNGMYQSSVEVMAAKGGAAPSSLAERRASHPASRATSWGSSTGPLSDALRSRADDEDDVALSGLTLPARRLHHEPVVDTLVAVSEGRRGLVDGDGVVPTGAAPVFGYQQAFALPTTRSVMIIYMCIASTESALLEIIPLWAISEREKGGLGLAPADIGVLLCISSIVYVAVNLVFSRILKALGGATRPLWDLSVMLWCVTSILTPCCAYIEDETSMFYAAAAATSTREIGLSWSYSIIFMYVVRSAPDECAGAINGIAQSIASFSRMVTMLVVPPIFAWSLNGVSHPVPFNFHFVFWVTCLPLLLTFAMSSLLPPRVSG